MSLPRSPSRRADLERAIHAIEVRVGRLLVLAHAQAATGRFELARQTRLLIVLRQDELNRLRARYAAQPS